MEVFVWSMDLLMLVRLVTHLIEHKLIGEQALFDVLKHVNLIIDEDEVEVHDHSVEL